MQDTLCEPTPVGTGAPVSPRQKRNFNVKLLTLYRWVAAVDALGAEMRTFALTLIVIGALNLSTVEVVFVRGIGALAIVSGVLMARFGTTSAAWRWLLFSTNILMTFASIVLAGYAAANSLTYNIILLHGLTGALCGALSIGAMTRLRHLLGKDDQLQLAWMLDANAWLAKTLCGGVIVLSFLIVPAPWVLFIVDVLFSLPIGIFLFLLAMGYIGGGDDDAKRAEDVSYAWVVRFLVGAFGVTEVNALENVSSNEANLQKINATWRLALRELWHHPELRMVFFTNLTRVFFLSVPLTVQVMKQEFGSSDTLVGIWMLASGGSGLLANLLFAALCRRYPGSWKSYYVLLAVVMPLSLLLASQMASGQWYIVAWFLFTFCFSPIDTMTDARLLNVEKELAVRIAEIRQLTEGVLATLFWLLLSSVLLAEFERATAALAVLAGAGLVIIATLQIQYKIWAMRRERKASERASERERNRTGPSSAPFAAEAIG